MLPSLSAKTANSVELVDKLQGCRDSLSKKALLSLDALGSTRESDKGLKLVYSILHETLIDYKEKKNKSASSVILLCVHFLISKWNDLKSPISHQLPSLIKACLSRICSVEEDLATLTEIGWDICNYPPLLDQGQEDAVAKWFLYGASHLSAKDTPCTCRPKGSSVCPLTTAFVAEFQSLFIRKLPHSKSQHFICGLLLLCFERHCCKSKLTKHHIASIVRVTSEILSGALSSVVDAPTNVCSILKKLMTLAINFGGHVVLNIKDAKTDLNHLSDELESICDFSNSDVIHICGMLLDYSVALLIKNIAFCQPFLKQCVDYIKKLCQIISYSALSMEQSSRIAFFLQKTTSRHTVENSLQLLRDIIYQSKVLSQIQECEYKLKFLGSVFTVCTVVVNEVSTQKSYELTEHVLSKLIGILSGQKFSEKSKSVFITADLGIAVVKVQRKLKKYSQAMESVENTIKIIPYKSSLHLADQWVKAKYCEYADCSDRILLCSRTLATNLKKNVSKHFLVDILFRELEMYVLLGMSARNILSVTTALLEMDRTLLEKRISFILRQHITAKFEIGEDLIDFDDLLDSKLDLQWEDVAGIKVIEFLQKWHVAMKNTECENAHLEMEELKEIYFSFKKAVGDRYRLNYITETCKAAHEACAIACLFGNYMLGLQIIGSLFLLLQYHDENDRSSTVKYNICSSLCEISSCYVSLNQIESAEHYANEATRAWDSYWKCVCGKTMKDNQNMQIKHLYFKVKSVQVRVLFLTCKKDEATTTMKQCLEDEYFASDQQKKSGHAVYCLCLLLASSQLKPAELCILNLIDLFKRLMSLKAIVLPELHNLDSVKDTKNCETLRLGSGLRNTSFDLTMQVNCARLLMSTIHALSKTYLLIGDVDLAKAYIHNGTVYAKYLRLKDMFLRFALLKVEVAAMLDMDQYSQIVEHFCKIAKCGCKAEESWISLDTAEFSADSMDDYEVSFAEDDIDNEILGSTDDDAIQIPTKKIDVLNEKSGVANVCSSPHLTKRVALKKSKVLQLFNTNVCSCASFSVLESTVLCMEFGVVHANFCIRNDNYDEALKISNYCLSAIANMHVESWDIDIRPVCEAKFWYEIQAEFIIAKALLLLAMKNRQGAIVEYQTANKLINESSPIGHKPSTLRAKLHILLADINQVPEKMEMQIPDIKQLNSFIDALSQPVDSLVQNNFTTPIAPKRSKRILSVKNTTNPTTKPIRAKRKKPASEMEENFDIFEDSVTSKLPIPQFQVDRSPSPDCASVYDIDAVDTQNIRITRKAARSRFKRKFGTTPTDEPKEKVRGRVTNKRPKSVKTKSRLKEVTCAEESISFDTDLVSIFENAMVDASSVGDFFTTKLAAQGLAECHFRSFQSTCNNLEISLAAAYHMLSVGIPTRSALNLYNTRIKKLSSGKAEALSLNQANDLAADHFEYLANKKLKYIEEVQQLLPNKWTVCVISATDYSSESTILVTRLRKSEIFHSRIPNKRFFKILQNFNSLMARNIEALKSRDKSYWWSQRRILDEELKDIILSFPSEILEEYSGVLLGSPIKDKIYCAETSMLFEQFPALENNSPLLNVILDSWYFLTVQQKLKAVKALVKIEFDETMISVAQALERISTKLKLHLVERGHVILILDKHVQLLPWESTTLLQKSSVTRMPSLDLLKHQLETLKSSKNPVLNKGINMNDVSYILNPNGDLKKSEERIREWFQHMKSWKGIVARVPNHKEWICSITDFDLFIYCGHGSGDRYISGRDLQRAETRAAALLMGCNSAKLDQDGLFEPNGIVLNYLISGSPCVVGCLWKVTDKDIDKYLYKLLERWADGNESPVSLSAVFAREGMKMPYINGAACVIYGLPIHCQASTANVLNSLPGM